MLDFWFSLSPFLLGLYYLAIFIVVINILLENRNPLKTHSYLLLLLLLPVIGLIIYLFFGQHIRKRRIFSKNQLINSAFGQKYIDEYLTDGNVTSIHKALVSEQFDKLIRFLSRDLSPLSQNNKVTLLKNGEEKFPALLEALNQAKNHIHIEYYIFTDDDIGTEISEALMAKAQEGVQVKMIVDGVGSFALSNTYFEKMKAAGVEIYEFMPVLFPSFTSKINYRNHRKIVIIDGKISFTGGLNVDDRYLNNGKYPTYWRDTHIKLEGTAVKTLQFLFILNWKFVSKQPWIPSEKDFPPSPSVGTSYVQVNASGPDWDLASIMDSFCLAINAARNSLQIATPYFIPSESIMNAITTSAKSGVSVEIMIPYSSDSWIVQSASLSFMKQLLEAGVKVYLYKKGFLHAKTLTVDRLISVVGSANMDHRSFDLNHEVNTYIYDPAVAIQLNESFDADKADCIQLNLRDWRKRSIRQKLLESVCRLLAPLL
ncbi:cardiolipin synthase [Roseivirga echinicomitans]